MKHNKINLLDKKTEFDFMPTMDTYILDGEDKRPAVVIFPGGGYSYTSDREAERIAVSYNACGYHTFIVYYCVAPHVFPLSLLNAAKAIETVRENADEWNVDKEKIAVCGFSAGGHLAASISTMWNDKEVFPYDDSVNLNHRPNATILAYPVITSGEFAHKGSFVNLTGSEEENNQWKSLSLENRIDKTTPQAFIWHTFSDQVVPVENSLSYACNLRKNNVSFEMHVYPVGEHGLSLVSDETIWSVPKFQREYPWMKQSAQWLNTIFGYIKL